MDRVSSCCLKLGFILFVLVAGTALAVSDSERDNLKTKLAAEEPLSQFEIQQIIELHDAGTPVVNGWQLSQLKEYGRIGDRPASSRRPGSTLDEYQYSVTTYNWFDISTLGTELFLEDDEAEIVALPFEFSFYEQTYTSMSLGANGYFVLGGTDTWSQTSDWDPIPSEWEPNNFVAMFWRDLNSNNGSQGHVYTYHDAANNRFIIQFQDVQHFPSGSPESFQCFLYSSGNIVIQYSSISDNSDVTVGIENQDGTVGLQICQANVGVDCPVNNLALLINQPDGFPNPITNFNANLSGSDVVLTWTDPTTDTNGNPLTIDNVQVWLGQPGIGTLLATVAGGVQTYTHANAPDGNLMYYVRPFADPYLGPATSTSIIVGDPSYLEDFEVTAGLWTSDNLDGWQWGSPTTGPGFAHGGANCWGTVLDGIYANNACYNLTLIPELAVVSAGATVEFWMWYSSEQSFDGCHFKISIDNGATWELVTPEDDYPQPSVFSNPCIGEEVPCWAGESDGWQYFVIPIGQYVGQTPQYRFTFGSDGSVQFPGFFVDDMTIWGLADPVGGDISGTITLDGGTGNVENVVVRADGLGAPVANPAANGSYLLEDVLVGERYVWATLANYQTTGTTVTLSEAGLTNINITLIRNLPPAPTGFTASVNAETGLITASWNASTDPMVDQYYLLKRYEGDTEWITAETTTATNVTHQLTSPGVYQVAAAAVDVDASSPVVSEPSEFARLLYGELPPVGLVYSGDHDNTISLYWFEPGTEPAVELSYDNGINSMWDAIGWSWLEEPPPFGWIVSKFEANGLAAVTQVRVYFNNYDATIIGDPFQIGIFPDDGFRMPTFEPLAVIDAVHEAPLNRWRDFEFIPPIVIPDGIFYIGTRQMSTRTVGLGGDIQTPFVTETFYWSFDGSQWDPYEPWELTIPMQRCVAYGDFGQEIILTPAPIDIPLDRLTTAWELVDAYSRQSGAVPPNLFTLGGQQILGNRMIPIGMPASLLLERAQNAVAPHPPTITIARSDSRRPSNTLDDVDYFIVYRDGLDISHPLELNYDDAGLMEGTDYHYYVTAHYDNGNESGPSPAVDAQCNMEPMPPTNLNGTNEGDTSMRLTWTDPTLNRDGSPCVDLTSVQVFRDGILAGSVAAGIQEYLDTPPDGAGTYSWTVKAADEVPNISAESVSFFGAVGNPSYSNGFEFDDGLWTTDEGWERGVPTSGPFAAHGGENCWATILAGDYPGNACYLMTLDIQLAVASASATLEFWAWWDIEGGWDGCNFKASVDGGQTWDIVEPQGGYPTVTNNVNTCNPNEPVWSNHPGLWQYIVIPIGQYIGQVPIFQFVFGSDPIVNYSGYYLDDMTIWGLQEPVTASVTGQVTLDGGAGDVEEVIVRADGLGVPQTNPAANGSYTLVNVLVGNRTIRGFLDGYNVASTPVFVTEVGPNVANLTLIRSNPPIVTGLTGSVDNATGEVTLNWDDSPDALVDFYYVYTRVHNTAPWTNAATAPLSQTVYTLPADGIWDITVTAVDEDVSTPVESAQAPYITVLYGALPPNNLTAIGNFDDRIRLNWFEPGNDFGQELAYDDGTAEAFVTVTTVNGDEDRLAVMFSPPPANEILYPLEITACAVFLENESSIASLSICPTQEWDNMPDIWVPYITWNDVAADAAPGWLTVETGGTVTLNEPTDFWLVVQLTPGQHGPGVGGDNTAANNRSFYGQWSWEWTQDSNFDYMMRIWIRGGGGLRSGGGDEYLLSVGDTEGCRIESIPRTSAVLSEKSDHKNAKQMKSAVRTLDEPEMIADKASTAGKAGKTTVSEKSQAAVSKYNLKNSGERSPFVKAPELRLQSREPRDGTLDDIDYYIVYRDGADVGHPTGTTYDDIGLAENVFHTYQVTSHYDDGDESAPSNTASAACNMAPAPPIGLTGTPIGSTQMRLDWANPTTNQDGTPLTDLASIRIYRDGSQIGSVAAGTATFTDTPPENDQPYTWTVRALDEVPNVSLDSEPFVGYVVSPWEEVDYEWIDISTSGINTGITGDDANGGPFDLGFTFEYFGDTYNSIYACSNGWASFTSTSTAYWNGELPTAEEPNAALYPFWDDLWVSGTASIKYYADTQNGRFILTWDQVPHLGSSSPNTFQIVISENGGIQFNYQTLTVAESPDHTVGVENADGTSAIQLCYNANGPWCAEENSSIAFWGRPQGEIRGQVRVFGSNQPIQNASIWSVGFVDTAYTDATGFYSLPVDTGSHNLMIHKQGYCDQLFPDIHIADDQSYVQNASMLWPNAQFSVTSINLLTRPGHNVSGTFEISNPNAGCQLEYSITTTQTWLSVSIEEGNVPVNETQLITVTANVAGISDGEYSADLVITHNDEDSPHTIPVNLVVGIDERAAPLPTEFAFHQNYPNPFNAVTSFGIDLPAEARVEIVIFNVMGQEVARPVRADYPAGRHSILFNAEALPSGMYLARMTAGEFSGLQKIVLLK